MRRALEPADDYSASIAVHEYAEAQAEADRDLADKLARRTAALDICKPDILQELHDTYHVDICGPLARCMRNVDLAVREINLLVNNNPFRQDLYALDALTTALSHLQRDLRNARYEQIKAGCLATVRGE